MGGKGVRELEQYLTTSTIISASLAEWSRVSEIGFLTVRGSKQFLSDRMANDTIKRCNNHSEKKFVLAKEIKVTNNFKCVSAVFSV